MTKDGRKTTGRADVVAPRLVIFDPELTYDLPANVTAASGMNAVAHCVEALWAAGATPLTDIAAEEGLRLLAIGIRALPAPSARPRCARDSTHGRLARGRGVRRRQRAAPQALPRDRRHARPAACRDARRTAALLGGLSPAGGARRGTPHRDRARRRGRGGGHRRAGPRGRHAGIARRARDERGRRRPRAAVAAEPELPERPRKPTLAELEELLLRAVRGTPLT